MKLVHVAVALACSTVPWIVNGTAEARAAVVAPASTTPGDDRAAPPEGSPDAKAEKVRVGVVAGAGFPRPFSVAALVKLERVVALGAEYSFLPAMTVSGVDVRFDAVAVDARVFPTQDAFFVGLRAGRQHLSGATTIAAGPYGNFAESVTMDTWFLNPRIGFLWTSRHGLSVGIDAGVQVPLSHTSTSTLPAGLSATQSVDNVTHVFGASVLPTVSLLQLGLLL